jgi:hypothetical protein
MNKLSIWNLKRWAVQVFAGRLKKKVLLKRVKKSKKATDTVTLILKTRPKKTKKA